MKKRKGSSATTDLRHFLQRSAAKKKQAVEPQIVTPSTNESQMQMVVFQGQSDTGTSSVQPQPVRDEQRRPVESPIIEDYESMPQDKSESSDSDEDNNDYDIEHDPGLRVPISSYPINDRDSVRRTLIAMGPCRPKMKKNDFPQHNCGGENSSVKIFYRLSSHPPRFHHLAVPPRPAAPALGSTAAFGRRRHHHEYAVNEEGLGEEQCHEPEPEDQYPGQELPEGCENEEDPDFVPEEVD